MRGEPAVGVVDAQVQAEFGAAGEHTIGLVRALGNQVIDQDRGVGFRAVQNQWRLLFYLQCGVDAGHQALACSFFVAGGAVDLATKEQARDLAGFERAFEFRGIDGVVLNGVTGAQHLGILKPGE